jgi:GTPase SAR1 family protein
MSKIPNSFKTDYVFKYVLVGETGVGKSGLLLRFVENNFLKDFTPTIGVDLKVKIVTLKNKKTAKLRIWVRIQ